MYVCTLPFKSLGSLIKINVYISLFFKEKQFFFSEDNIKLIRNTLSIVIVVNDYSRWKRLVNEISASVPISSVLMVHCVIALED